MRVDIKKYIYKPGRRVAALMMVAAVGFSTSACGLLSPAQQEHSVEIVTEDVSERYDLGMVEYRDVVLTDLLSCTYSQLGEDALSFKTGGREVKYLYVSEGEKVSEGQLLAKLNVDDLEEDLIRLNDEIAQYELRIKHQNELLDFYEKRLASPSISLVDKEDYRLKVQECRENIRLLDTSIELNRQTIETQTQTIEDSKIYSLRDGSISDIEDGLVGSYSNSGHAVIKVIDNAACAFKVRDAEACTYLKVGDGVIVTLSSGPQHSASVSEVDPDNSIVMFELDEPDYTISVGTRGTISVELDSRTNVLTVQKTAVFSTEEFSYVYIINENGVRDICKVEVGLVGDNYVEILSGLNLYDSVIIRKS